VTRGNRTSLVRIGPVSRRSGRRAARQEYDDVGERDGDGAKWPGPGPTRGGQQEPQLHPQHALLPVHTRPHKDRPAGEFRRLSLILLRDTPNLSFSLHPLPHPSSISHTHSLTRLIAYSLLGIS
jgi:hypothetical protein